MKRYLLLLLLVCLLPLLAVAQTRTVSPDVISSAAINQASSQVAVTGSIGQVMIGPVAGPENSSVNQGFWPQVRQLNLSILATPDVPDALVPLTFELRQNYPNPFNPTTTIPFSLAQQSETALVIFNTLGQVVREFDLSTYGPGHYELTWQGRNDAGMAMPSGIYFYRLTAAAESAVGRMLLLK